MTISPKGPYGFSLNMVLTVVSFISVSHYLKCFSLLFCLSHSYVTLFADQLRLRPWNRLSIIDVVNSWPTTILLIFSSFQRKCRAHWRWRITRKLKSKEEKAIQWRSDDEMHEEGCANVSMDVFLVHSFRLNCVCLRLLDYHLHKPV